MRSRVPWAVSVGTDKGDGEQSDPAGGSLCHSRHFCLQVVQEQDRVQRIVDHPTQPFPPPLLLPHPMACQAPSPPIVREGRPDRGAFVSHLEAPEGSKSGRNPHHIPAVFGESGSELSSHQSFRHTPDLEGGGARSAS